MCGQEEQEPGFSSRHRLLGETWKATCSCWAGYLGPAVVTGGNQGLLIDANRFLIHI